MAKVADHLFIKNDFTIDTDGVPICPAGQRMHRDGGEAAKRSNENSNARKCTEKMVVFPVPDETPCSDAKYGRTVHFSFKG